VRRQKQMADQETQKPVRKISNRGCRKIIGKFPSIKCGRSVMFESLLEMDFLFILEMDSLVSTYSEQPLVLTYHLNGKLRKYVPDFKIQRTGIARHQLIEVKPLEKVFKQLNKFKQVKKAAEAKGYEFHIMTEIFIRQEPRLSIIKYLHRYSTIQLRKECLFETITFLRKLGGSSSLGLMRDHLVESGFTRQDLYKMVYDGVLQVGFSTPLAADSKVSLKPSFMKD
jgi:hypothetical protein